MKTPMSTDPMVAALLREREGYRRYGKADREAAVDEQLRLRGYEDDAEPEPEKTPPRGRATRQEQQQVASASEADKARARPADK